MNGIIKEEYTGVMRVLLATVLLAGIAVAAFYYGPESQTRGPTELRVGVLPDQDPAALRKRFNPLINYLGRYTGLDTRLLVPKDYETVRSEIDRLIERHRASADVRGEFGVIDTAVPGIKFTEHLPTLAKELKRYSVLRGLNPRNGSHGTADAIMMSGHKFNPSITYPCYGSVVAKDVDPYMIAGGVPAKVIGERNRDQRPRRQPTPARG